MNPRTLIRAKSLAVVRALDGTFRVAGTTDVHTVYESFVTRSLICSCKAGRSNHACAHALSVRMYRDRQQTAGIRQGE